MIRPQASQRRQSARCSHFGQELHDEFVERFEEQSDLLKFRRRAEVIDDLLSAFGPEMVRRFENTQLVIFKPDAVCSHKALEIAEFMNLHGCSFLECWPVFSFSEHQYEELYRYNIDLDHKSPMVGKIWSLRSQFVGNPCIVCLVTVDADTTATSIFNLTKLLKGNSTPYFASPGQIRYVFNGSSKALNLVHMSDDPFSTLREIKALLGPDCFEIQSLRASPERNRATLDAIAAFTTSLGPKSTDSDFCATLVRMLHKLSYAFGPGERHLAQRLQALKIPDVRDGPRRRLRDLNDNFKHLLGELGAQHGSDGPTQQSDLILKSAVLSVLDVPSWTVYSVKHSIASMRSFDIPVSAWEEEIVISNAVFHEAILEALDHRDD